MFWSTKKLAEKTGLTQRHIDRLAKSGVLAATMVGHSYVVSEEDALRFLKSRGLYAPDADNTDDNETASLPPNNIAARGL